MMCDARSANPRTPTGKGVNMKGTDIGIPQREVYKCSPVKSLILLLLITCFAVLSGQKSLSAEETVVNVPTRFGMTVTGGNSYDPNGKISFLQVSGFALFDHERIFPHKAPDALRFKVEGGLGSLTGPKRRFMASVHIFSLYYIDALSTTTFKPYVEGGIGGVYMDYRWKGQGTRLNFNPQFGIGAEINTASPNPLFLSLRAYHVSNAGLNKHNRGLNSVTLSIGRFF